MDDDLGSFDELRLRFVFVPYGEEAPEHLIAGFGEVVRLPADFVPRPEPAAYAGAREPSPGSPLASGMVPDQAEPASSAGNGHGSVAPIGRLSGQGGLPRRTRNYSGLAHGWRAGDRPGQEVLALAIAGTATDWLHGRAAAKIDFEAQARYRSPLEEFRTLQDSPQMSATESPARGICVHPVADDGTPGNNQAQNAQVDAVVRILGLTKDQRQALHREISGENHGFQEILKTAKDMFGR